LCACPRLKNSPLKKTTSLALGDFTVIVLTLRRLPATVSRALIVWTTCWDAAPHPRVTELMDGLVHPAATATNINAPTGSVDESRRLARLGVARWSVPSTASYDWGPGPGPEEPELGQAVHG
jgi:hypothetical protein